MKIYENITELVGNTPLVKINNINHGNATILAKLEYFNPSNSLKDRAAKYMLEMAQKEGLVNKDTVVIEPTSGNTGIGLAMCAAQKGLKMILTMPESMSEERKKMLKGYGAELVLTPATAGMQGAVDKAIELSKEYQNSFIPSQFTNKYNPQIHELTTAEEIWKDTDGKVDVVIAGIGSGGTITGTAKRLKELKENVYSVGVEPKESPLLSHGHAGSHGIQGIGANFVPENYKSEFVDEIFDVPTEKAIETAKNLAKKEGILTGISSGAAMYAALELAKLDEYKGKFIVAILPDFGERYLSTPLFKD
ncbi:MAG: cysteine synthase A [Candidatus Gastranaerophilales bacterium]|nr:cysteine synthase A [Candidatus Gastranaerophilales bacterium]